MNNQTPENASGPHNPKKSQIKFTESQLEQIERMGEQLFDCAQDNLMEYESVSDIADEIVQSEGCDEDSDRAVDILAAVTEAVWDAAFVHTITEPHKESNPMILEDHIMIKVAAMGPCDFQDIWGDARVQHGNVDNYEVAAAIMKLAKADRIELYDTGDAWVLTEAECERRASK